MDMSSLRRNYDKGTLDEAGTPDEPFALFEDWFTQARDLEGIEPNAMTLATADADGRPSTRIVLLKSADEHGFVFFTNYGSAKGSDLAANPQAALLFFWEPLQRQVRVEGRVEKVSAQESDEYFALRPRASQLGAWASKQSRVIASRQVLVDGFEAAQQRFGDDVPRPEYWGGYRLTPELVEFWQGRPSRLHDRLRYRLDKGVWVRERLAS